MDILYQYFLSPIMGNGWFNPVNSAVYGILLILGIFLVFRLLGRLNVSADKWLFLAVTPFIAFAGVTRTLRDYIYFNSSSYEGFLQGFSSHMSIMQENAYDYVMGITGNHLVSLFDSYVIAWFPTPGSYLITFVFALLSLLLSLLIQKFAKVDYWKPMFLMGLLLFSMNAILLPIRTVVPLVNIGTVSLLWAMVFFSITFFPELKTQKKSVKKLAEDIIRPVKEVFTPINSAILSAHLADATATFFAISFFTTAGGHGYLEQHFLPRFLMPFFGPQVMFLLKLVVVIPVLYYLDKHVKNRELSGFLKLAVFVLGLSPALRNTVRLMVGV